MPRSVIFRVVLLIFLCYWCYLAWTEFPQEPVQGAPDSGWANIEFVYSTLPRYAIWYAPALPALLLFAWLLFRERTVICDEPQETKAEHPLILTVAAYAFLIVIPVLYAAGAVEYTRWRWSAHHATVTLHKGHVVAAKFQSVASSADLAILDSGFASTLHILDLSGTQICDDDLRTVAQLPELRDLNLLNTRIGDRGVLHLKASQLTSLNLARTAITDEAMATVSGMPQLIRLGVDKTQITEQGIYRVWTHPKLYDISARGCPIDPRAVGWQQRDRQRPRLEIDKRRE